MLAVSPAGYRPLAAALRPEGGYRPRELAAFLALCADARAAVTRDDPLERGPGRALGYGRTVGRAIRLLAGGALGEGPSEGLGMLVAARIAVRLGLLPAEDEQAHRDLLRRAGLPVVLPPGVDPAGLAAAVPVAAARDGEDGLVLLTGLGRPHTGRGSLLTGVDDRALRAGAEAVRPTGVPHSRTPALPASRPRPSADRAGTGRDGTPHPCTRDSGRPIVEAQHRTTHGRGASAMTTTHRTHRTDRTAVTSLHRGRAVDPGRVLTGPLLGVGLSWLEPDAELDLDADGVEHALYVTTGSGRAGGREVEVELAEGTGLTLPLGGSVTLAAGPAGLEYFHAVLAVPRGAHR